MGGCRGRDGEAAGPRWRRTPCRRCVPHFLAGHGLANPSRGGTGAGAPRTPPLALPARHSRPRSRQDEGRRMAAEQLPYLETFALAAELGNFTAAARALGLTQAAV